MPGQRFFFKPTIIDTTPWVKKVVSGRFTSSKNSDLAILCWETGGRCEVDSVKYEKGFLVKTFINTSKPGAVGATFVPGQKLEYIDNAVRTFPMYPSDIAVGDINGDGFDDIIVANSHSDHIFIFISRGDGTFNPPIEIDNTGADDPCYVTLGHFSGSKNLDIAVLHTSRSHPAPGENFVWTFSFLFGDGHGNFQPPITQNLGKRSVPDTADGGFYYHSSHFNFFTMKNSVDLSGGFRDAVAMGTVMRWWDGTQIAGPDNPADHFATSLGQHVTDSYTPGRDGLAMFGGRVTMASLYLPADLIMTKGDTENLDKAWLGYSGSGITNDCSGIHVIAADFDKDKILDVLLFCDSFQKTGHSMVLEDQHFFVAYGKDSATNPLQLASTAPEFERLKFVEGPAGALARGHRPWRTVVADFDLDEFPDIVHSTLAGLVLFTNVGIRAVDFPRPEIDSYFLDPPRTPSDPWDGDRLVIDFRILDDQNVSAAVFRPAVHGPGAPEGYVLPMDQPAATRGWVYIPDEDRLPVGDYKLSVHNGNVESSNSVPIKVIARPIFISSIRLIPIAKGASSAVLEVEGFFGSNSDYKKTTFDRQLDVASPPPPIGLIPSRMSKEKAVFPIFYGNTPGSYKLTAAHPTRGTVTAHIGIPDFLPHIWFAHWNNPDASWGDYNERRSPRVSGAPLKKGARVEVQGTWLYAPDTTNWALLDKAGAVFARGTGSMTSLGGITNDNNNGAFLFFPNGLPDTGKDLQLQLTTTVGFDSNPVGPINIGDTVVDPKDPEWFIGVEYLDGGKVGYCGYPSFRAKEQDQPDPAKPPGALQQAKVMFPGNYMFTPLKPGQETLGLCLNRHWEIEAEETDGTRFPDVETAITEERARVNFASVYAPARIISITKRMKDP